MKFSQKLNTHLTPEWRNQYINYTEFKTMLIHCIENAPTDIYDLRATHTYYGLFEDDFFQKCEIELQKVNTFFAEKLAESTRKHVSLMAELKKHLAEAESKGRLTISDLRPIIQKSRLKYFKFAFSELYFSMVLLQNYQTLNHTGFRKILKKHDKLLHTKRGLKWFEDVVDNAAFHTNSDLLNHIRGIEDTFTLYLEGGERHRAMKRLRVPPLSEIHYPWTTFGFGFYSGIFVVLSILLYLSFQMVELSTVNYVACIHLYRGPFLLIFFLALIGVNIYGWRKAGVNHVLIFELEPRDHLTASHVLEMATAIGVLWTLSVLGFLHAHYLNVPPYVFPLLMCFMLLTFLINPLPIFHYNSRMWLLKLIGRVISAPFFPVSFADFWLGDQMNSMITCFIDFEYIICFYITNWNWYNAIDPELCLAKNHIIVPAMNCLPAWFRFAQCLRRYRDTRLSFPFLVNAGKYATTFPVVLFGTLMVTYRDSYESTFESPFVWGYLISYTVSTIYCYAWDVLRDFGIFTKFSGENIFLRDQIVYSPRFYYFAIIEDFLLRLFWILSFYLREQNLVTYNNITSIGGFLEIFRRYVWNYLRLENEHLFNAGQFRAVRDIYVIPLDPSDQMALQKAMDEIDGVTNRYNIEKKDE